MEMCFGFGVASVRELGVLFVGEIFVEFGEFGSVLVGVRLGILLISGMSSVEVDFWGFVWGLVGILVDFKLSENFVVVYFVGFLELYVEVDLGDFCELLVGGEQFWRLKI